MRVAALDLGSNTFLLLIAETENGTIKSVVRDENRVTRLAQGVDKTGRFHPEALVRVDQCFAEYRKIIDEVGVDKIYAVATSAARDAENREEFFAIAEKYNFQISVIPGEKEADVTFRGATYEFKKNDDLLVIDIGGGSTEFISAHENGKVLGVSLNIGSVRLTERFVTERPISEETIASAHSFIRQELEKVTQNTGSGINKLVAVAGTPTTLAALAQNIGFEEPKIHGFELNTADIKAWANRFAQMQVSDIEALNETIKGRADVIFMGASILYLAAEAYGFDKVHVSTKGVRYGVALEGERLQGDL